MAASLRRRGAEEQAEQGRNEKGDGCSLERRGQKLRPKGFYNGATDDCWALGCPKKKVVTGPTVQCLRASPAVMYNQFLNTN
jgi:hypothetical protein